MQALLKTKLYNGQIELVCPRMASFIMRNRTV